MVAEGPLPGADDVAREIALLAAQTLGAADAALLAVALEHAIKHRFGGDAVYIRAPRPVLAERIVAVRRDRDAGVPVGQIIRRHGISRATLYRYLRVSHAVLSGETPSR